MHVTSWLAWVRHASLGIAYEITREDTTLIVGATEHAAVDAETGRPRRMPRERRAEMLQLVPPA